MHLIQTIINGTLLGGIYALLGIGMNMIFGIVKLTNLAHGEFIILGAYLSVVLSHFMGIDPVLTLFITVPLMFLIGYALQYFLIDSAMKKGSESALLVTFGLSIIIKDSLLLIFTADAQHIATSYAVKTVSIGDLNISVLNLILFGISFVSMLMLMVFLSRSHTGRAIRATADDKVIAAVCGVNVKRIHAIAMGLAMAGAAIAGTCVGMKWTFYPNSGGSYLLISFVVVVLGGMGSVPGTFVAGLLFGLAQVVGGANYGMLISYALLIIILIFKPKGILQKN